MSTVDGIHETFEGDVQYPFADVGAPELLHIGKVNQDNRRDYKYSCPYCKKALRPRLCKGNRRSHFAHNPGECCDRDRYIHTTAERLLKEKWDRDEPFEISMKVRTVCSHYADCPFGKALGDNCSSYESKTYDLKKYYTQCLVEKKYDEFVPDLCLIDETGRVAPIFIEIWSKHKNSEKKADSKYRIIEIRLKSVFDLEQLTLSPITESETVTFSHFKESQREPDETNGPALMKFTLYADSLKSYVDATTVNCVNYKTKHHPKALLEIVGLQNEIYSPSSFRKYGNAIAIRRGYDIRSCYLCRQFGKDNSSFEFDPTTGRFIDSDRGCRRDLQNQGLLPCKPEDARTCDQYIVKDYSIKGSIDAYSTATIYIWERHPDGTETEEIQEGKVDKSEVASVYDRIYHLV